MAKKTDIDYSHSIDMFIDISRMKRLAIKVINSALMEAELEIMKNPYENGPACKFLMNEPVLDGQYEKDSSLCAWLNILEMDLNNFKDIICKKLDDLSRDSFLENKHLSYDKAEKEKFLIAELFPELKHHSLPDKDVMRKRRTAQKNVTEQLNIFDILEIA